MRNEIMFREESKIFASKALRLWINASYLINSFTNGFMPNVYTVFVTNNGQTFKVVCSTCTFGVGSLIYCNSDDM
jgi:hypothetical protein